MNKVDKIYIYDGTFEGLLTIVYKVIYEKKIPLNIMKEGIYKTNLFETYEYINTNYDFSSKVLSSIPKKISDLCLYYVYNSFLANKKDKEMNILFFLINGYKYGKKITNLRNLDCVVLTEKYAKMVRRESHRLKGFVRFKTINNVLYSEISPENDILELLIPHFKNRLKNELWVIEDIKRKKAVFYNKKEFKIIDTKKINFNSLLIDSEEINYENLWKKFIKSVTIKERKNLRCQMNFMPKKYWKYMSEMEANNE